MGSSSRKPKERKAPPPPPADWTRCHGYLIPKSRYCRQLPAPGTRFCGTHQPLSAGNKRKRIPCPIDPSHDVYEDLIAKHVKKCPRQLLLDQQAKLECYKKNCNSGGHGSSTIFPQSLQCWPADDGGTVEATPRELTWTWAETVALAVLRLHQHVFEEPQSSSPASSVVPTKEARKDLTSEHCTTGTQSAAAADGAALLTQKDIETPRLLPVDDAGLEREYAPLVEAMAAHRIKSGGPHHQRQQASLVGHVRKRSEILRHCNERVTSSVTAGATPPPIPTTTTVLELGAGRGMAGLVVAGVVAKAAAATHKDRSTTRLIMVERGASRHNADKWLRQRDVLVGNDAKNAQSYLQLHTVQAKRIRCDLAHANMDEILRRQQEEPSDSGGGLNSNELIVVAKHLCGAGTDLALASLRNIPAEQYPYQSLTMSTCCHGVCSWNDYVGRDYLGQSMVEVGGVAVFGTAEFELLRRWSSGTCKVVHQQTETNAGSSPKGDADRTADDGGPEDEHNTNDVDNRNDDDFPLSTIVQRLHLRCGEQGLGRACQRVIDYGRREYISKELGFQQESSLVYYVSSSVTVQNALLVARRHL